MDIPAHPSSPGRSGHRRLYARAARDGWQALLEELAPSGRPVLLPGYVGWSPNEGSGLHDPVRATGMEAAFYPLDDRMRVELEAFEALLDEREPAAVVLVHWFGFPEPATLRVADLCRTRDVLLVEDCCHGIGGHVGSRALGEIGDYTMVSLHKVLAAPHGGYLQANGDRPLPGPVSEEARIDPADLAELASADLEEQVRRRRANYVGLRARVSGLPGVRLLHDGLPDGAVPLNVPLLVDEVDRYEVYKAMRARGIGVVALYHTLVDGLDADAFPAAFHLSERILNLPCHQELGEAELDRVARALAEAMEEVTGGSGGVAPPPTRGRTAPGEES